MGTSNGKAIKSPKETEGQTWKKATPKSSS